jgi:HEPN domain-containing protein
MQARTLAGAALLALVALAALPYALAAPNQPQQSQASQSPGAPRARAVERIIERVGILVNRINEYNATLASEINETLNQARSLLDEGNVTGAFRLALQAARDAVEALHELGLRPCTPAASLPPDMLERAIRVHEARAQRMLEVASALSEEYNTSRAVELLNQSIALLEQAEQLAEEGNASGAARLMAQAVHLIGEAARSIYSSPAARGALAMQGGLAGLVERSYRALEAINETYSALQNGSANASEELGQAIRATSAALRLAIRLESRPHIMALWFTQPLNTLTAALQQALSLLQQARQALDAGDYDQAAQLVGQASEVLAAALSQVENSASAWPPLLIAIQAAHGHHPAWPAGPGGWHGGQGPRGPRGPGGGGCPCPGGGH